MKPVENCRQFQSCLTHISIASFLLDIGLQCKTRSDAAKRGVLSGSTMFAYRSFFKKRFGLISVPTVGPYLGPNCGKPELSGHSL